MGLVEKFAYAGLTLKLSDQPIIGSVRGGEGMVQIDIQRKVKGNLRREWFRIYPGAEENLVEVVSTDKRIGQVVLMVKEGVRDFMEDIPPFTLRRLVQASPTGWLDTLCKENHLNPKNVQVQYRKDVPIKVSIRRKTSARTRHFLMGLDERQLFIATLPRSVTTVREAHKSLKGTDITLAEGRAGKSLRQGEFFFIPATAEEIDLLEKGIEKNQLFVRRKVAVGSFAGRPSGNPHTADELVVMAGKVVEGGKWPVRGGEVFIRGKVRHKDHATVRFNQWRKVIQNSEPAQATNSGSALSLGVGWVD